MAKPKNMKVVQAAKNQFLLGVFGFSRGVYPCIEDDKDSKLKDLLIASEKIWELHINDFELEGLDPATKILERKLSPMFDNYHKESGEVEEKEELNRTEGTKDSKKRPLSPASGDPSLSRGRSATKKV